VAAECDEPKKIRATRSVVLSSRPDYERIGLWIRGERMRRGVGQKELSRKLGKPEQFMNKVEHGRQRIDLVEFLDVAAILGLGRDVTLADLLGCSRGSNVE
jgi:ribosome-binding protein aMBF1 (putative translation factor)